jgi:hypothetical protein
VVARNVGFHRPGQPLKVDLQQPAWIVLLGPPETLGPKPKERVVAWLPQVQIMVCDPACSYPSAAIFLCCYSTFPSMYTRRGPFCWPGFCRRVSPTVRNAHGRWFRLLAAEGTSIPRLTPLPALARSRARMSRTHAQALGETHNSSYSLRDCFSIVSCSRSPPDCGHMYIYAPTEPIPKVANPHGPFT